MVIRSSFILWGVLMLGNVAGSPSALGAQYAPHPISRTEAIDSALAHGIPAALARADTVAAFARLVGAGAYPNPTLNSSYSKSTPQYHVTVDFPLEFPAVRTLRIQSARANRRAVQLRYAFARSVIVLTADTAYTRAVVARERMRLSARNARDADSLRSIAVKRYEAGDVSDLDVDLATVSAGQAANVASTDSLTFQSAVLDLQAVMGMSESAIMIAPDDSLTDMPTRSMPIPEVNSSGVGAKLGGEAHPGAQVNLKAGAADRAGDTATSYTPLAVGAAAAALQSAQLTERLEHHSVFSAPSVTAGFEVGDPSGTEPGILPTVGLSFPLPLFNRNQGAMLQAKAEREKTQAALVQAKLQYRTEVARLRRTLTISSAKVGRDRQLLTTARRVAAMALTAYREGAVPLPSVLEAQRSARDMYGQYIDDLAAVWIAQAEFRMLAMTSSSDAP